MKLLRCAKSKRKKKRKQTEKKVESRKQSKSFARCSSGEANILNTKGKCVGGQKAGGRGMLVEGRWVRSLCRSLVYAQPQWHWRNAPNLLTGPLALPSTCSSCPSPSHCRPYSKHSWRMFFTFCFSSLCGCFCCCFRRPPLFALLCLLIPVEKLPRLIEARPWCGRTAEGGARRVGRKRRGREWNNERSRGQRDGEQSLLLHLVKSDWKGILL